MARAEEAAPQLEAGVAPGEVAAEGPPGLSERRQRLGGPSRAAEQPLVLPWVGLAGPWRSLGGLPKGVEAG